VRSATRLATLAVSIAFAAFAAVVISDLIRAHGEAAPYFIGDWQINYAAGFVRRGLLGEFARLLFVHFSIDTRTTIVFMQIVFYVVFFGASALLFSSVLTSHPMLAFAVFSPLAVPFKALDSGVAATGVNATTGAKEIVFLALLALQAALSTHKQVAPAAGLLRSTVLAVAWAAVVLVHEGLFFFLPFSVAILVLTSQAPIPATRLALMLVPALVTFAVSGAFHGNTGTAATICESLGAGAPADCQKTGAIAWLARPATVYIMSTYYQIVQPPYILLATAQAAMLGGVGVALAVADRRIANVLLGALKQPAGLILAIACIVVPIPAFLASDHGRFLHIWFCGAAIVMAVLLRPGQDSNSTPSAAEGLLSARLLTRGAWIVLLAAFATSWNAWGACCPDRLGTGFLGRAFLFITRYL
jgi:hypothetical protein